MEKRKCPKCSLELVKVPIPHKRNIFGCKNGHLFRLHIKKKKDMTDSRNWKKTCNECGGIMDYYNFKYGCRKCSNVLYV